MSKSQNPTRTVKADLHTHLHTSSTAFDKENILHYALKAAQKRLGKGAVMGVVLGTSSRQIKDEETNVTSNVIDPRWTRLTEYSTNLDAINLHNALYFPNHEVLVVRGQQIQSSQGQVLALALPYIHFRNNRSFRNTVDSINEAGGLAIVSAPFAANGSGRHLQLNHEDLEGIAGWEVYNGQAATKNLGQANERSKEQLEFINSDKTRKPIPGIRTSDATSISEIGRNYMSLEMPLDYSALKTPQDVTSALSYGLSASQYLSYHQSPFPGAVGRFGRLVDLAALGLNDAVVPHIIPGIKVVGKTTKLPFKGIAAVGRGIDKFMLWTEDWQERHGWI